jgi:hypothetical protein
MNKTSYLRLHGPIQLASAKTECWSCHKTTAVHALLAQDLEDVEEGDEPMRLEARTFVYEVDEEELPEAVRRALAQHAAKYLPTYSRTTGETSWASRCEHCDALQGAFYQHSEPDGPFFGGPDEFSGTLKLLSDEGFDLESGSYSM